LFGPGIRALCRAAAGGSLGLVLAALAAAAMALAQSPSPSEIEPRGTVESADGPRDPASSGVPAPAATVLPEDIAAVARDLNCPLCQGYNLQDCPLPVCAQMRELIGQKLAAGESKEQITAAFVADYGPQVLNAPPARGFYLTAWVLPVVVLLAGLVALWAFLWRGTSARGGAVSAMARAGGTAARVAPADLAPDADTDLAIYAERLERLASARAADGDGEREPAQDDREAR